MSEQQLVFGPVDERTLQQAFDIFSRRQLNPEYLIGYEGNAFTSTGNPASDILSITAVHPLREDALRKMLQENSAGWEVVTGLIDQGALTELDHGGRKYYLRTLRKRTMSQEPALNVVEARR